MNNTKLEIEKIKRHFEQTNSQCENLSKEHDTLKITLQSLEEDNCSLSK
jgi:prefoldin subunit 5